MLLEYQTPLGQREKLIKNLDEININLKIECINNENVLPLAPLS